MLGTDLLKVFFLIIIFNTLKLTQNSVLLFHFNSFINKHFLYYLEKLLFKDEQFKNEILVFLTYLNFQNVKIKTSQNLVVYSNIYQNYYILKLFDNCCNFSHRS